ncbi:hypothetical protein [Macrococcus carouselicus]|uniref:Uncharacterized protein n=1 Tax=Macrococcus carouselicus TaxID=69969 RepID=A0A9Q8CM69_9STAP|nr:hypothetical protein [Macrococcus carouselicus]TDM02468.1 hypothetical protein ERX40_07900 [Macrococcus carouselicus]
MNKRQDIKFIVVFILVIVAISTEKDFLKWLLITVLFAYQFWNLMKLTCKRLHTFPADGNFLINRKKDIYLLTLENMALSFAFLIVGCMLILSLKIIFIIGGSIAVILLVVGTIIEYLLKGRSDVWEWDEENRL